MTIVSRSVRTALPARSAVLSLLLGAHPARLSAAELVRAGDYLDIAEPTLRVALSRAVASGDLIRADGHYALGERLVERQRRQDESVRDASLSWDGRWEQIVVVEVGRSAADRAALRAKLARSHLAELREGVWMRPANRDSEDLSDDHAVVRFVIDRVDDPGELAARLWDLAGWALRGRALLAELASTGEPAMRLSVAADLVRHLLDDPLLPQQLLPLDWPGTELRSIYADYQTELITAWS